MTEHTPPRAEPLRRALNRRELAAVRHRNEISRRLGVSEDEMLVLLHLAEHGGMTQTRLAALIGLSRSGMGAMIQRLERAGMIERHADPADRRVRLIELSARSRDRLTRAFDELWSDVERLLERFSADEQDAIARFLAYLADTSEWHVRRVAVESEQEPAGASRPVWRLWG